LVTATEPPAARLTRLQQGSGPPWRGGHGLSLLPHAPMGAWMLGTMALSIRPATSCATHPPLLPSCLGLRLATAAGVTAAA
ncbi:unnamed protein product, partial [Closterium sp. NIES-64]